jgi:hypothetical protein
MIVAFSRYGTGHGKGPTQYITDEKREGRENAAPVVLHGDSQRTCQLIDSLEFKHKYTSGVLSFAAGETITPEMEENIIERFEKVAFAGLEADQYNILWVRHTHAGHHELHFVTPRIELSSGKSLNIRPPGEATKQLFDDFRSEINARYGLADPTDPNRARNISIPDHELKMASEALRMGQKAPDNMRDIIDRVLSQRAVQGLIRNRDDVLEQIKEMGLETTRTGKDYITVSDAESGQRWRLKGALYARDYEPSRTIEKADSARERDYSKPNPEAAQRYAERVELHISARAEYHQSRYRKPKRESLLAHVHEPILVADRNRSESLSRYLQRELCDDQSFFRSDNRSAIDSEATGGERGKDSVQPVWGEKPALRPSTARTRDVREKQRELHDSEGVLNDRTGKSLAERFEAFGEAIQRTTQSIRGYAIRFAHDVRTYFRGEQESTPPSRQLEQASDQLKRATPAIRQTLQLEQALKQRQKEIDHSRSSRGFSR